MKLLGEFNMFFCGCGLPLSLVEDDAVGEGEGGGCAVMTVNLNA